MTQPICRTCAFSRPPNRCRPNSSCEVDRKPIANRLECRRFAPTPQCLGRVRQIDDDDEEHFHEAWLVVWPLVFPHDWCSEHQPKKKRTARPSKQEQAG